MQTPHRNDEHARRLARRVLGAALPLVILDALPGSGRDALLQICAAHGARIRALSPDAPPFAPADIPGDGALIAAGRIDQVTGGAVAALTGRAVVFGNADLFLPETLALHPARSCGWPALDRYLAGPEADPRIAAAFIGDALKSQPAERRDLLRLLLLRPDGVEDAALSEEERADLRWLRPLVRLQNGAWFIAGREFAELLQSALKTTPPGPGWADLMRRCAGVAAAVRAALAASQPDVALELARSAGGAFLMHREGPEAAAAVVRAFGDAPPPDVAALGFLLAAKNGDIETASRILSAAGGPGILDHTQALRRAGSVPPPLMFCRLMLAIYRSVRVRPHMLEEASDLLARAPREESLLRGGIYNAILELLIRDGRLTEASDAASRALTHYQAGGAPYLEFFIHLHRTVIALRQSDPRAAKAHLALGADALAKVAFRSAQDERFIALLGAVTAYEGGDPEPMVAFASGALQEFTFGELWPSMAELALSHGCDALLLLRGHAEALAYVDGWRLQAWRTRRFGVMLEQRGVILAQTARRWSEARASLEDMTGRFGRAGLAPRPHMLRELRAHDDILQALLWLRQACFETPRDAALQERLDAMSANPVLSARQHLCLQIWQSWIDRRQGRLAVARRRLLALLERGEAMGLRAPLLEERMFLIPLLDDARLMTEALRRAPAPGNLRKGALAAVGSGPLSPQEWRALLLLAEGCGNKDIARQMGLSLPTVKFHLKNLYRKLGAHNRREALTIARSRELIS